MLTKTTMYHPILSDKTWSEVDCVCVWGAKGQSWKGVVGCKCHALKLISWPQRSSWDAAFARSQSGEGSRSGQWTTTGHVGWCSRWSVGNALLDTATGYPPQRESDIWCKKGCGTHTYTLLTQHDCMNITPLSIYAFFFISAWICSPRKPHTNKVQRSLPLDAYAWMFS